MGTPTWTMHRLPQDELKVRKVRGLLVAAIGLIAYSAWASGLPEASNDLRENWSGVGVIFLLLLCGLVGSFLWFKRRTSQLDSAYRLKLVGGISLGPKERLLMVKLNERVLVLGVTTHQVTLITDFPDSDFRLAAETTSVSSLDESK